MKPVQIRDSREASATSLILNERKRLVRAGLPRRIIEGMDTITLNTARIVMKAIQLYQGPMVADTLVNSIAVQTSFDPSTVTKVIEFLQELKGPASTELAIIPSQPPHQPNQPPDQRLSSPIDDKPLDLMEELTYNYKVAKRCLELSMAGDRVLDAEEARKSLTTISKFMEQALKLQERLFNAQQIQKFQDAVLDEMATMDVALRDRVLERLLQADL